VDFQLKKEIKKKLADTSVLQKIKKKQLICPHVDHIQQGHRSRVRGFRTNRYVMIYPRYEWTGKRMREGKSSKLSSKKGASVSKFTLIKLFLTGEDLFFCFHVKNSDFSLIVSTNLPLFSKHLTT
jgi:hypothetical protein